MSTHANPASHLERKKRRQSAKSREVYVVAAHDVIATDKQITPKEKEKILTKKKEGLSVDTLDELLEEFVKYKAWHPRFARTIIAILGIAVLLVSAGLTVQYFLTPKAIEPVLTKVEGIKQLGNLRLVKHHYESVIPITKDKLTRAEIIKNQKLQFLLVAPVEISGFVDVSNMQVEKKPDSLLIIRIPPSEISDPYLDLSNTEEYLMEGKSRLFGKYLEFVNHEEAYTSIVKGLNGSKEKVKERAIANDIGNQTENRAELFLRNFASNLGYRVQISIDSSLSKNYQKPPQKEKKEAKEPS
ncbi:MAG: DUF4230 domain-containing protein [Bacteroidota bacterium]